MATLQKIRNHGVFLIVIVGLAMLAFILGDFLNSGSSFFNRSREYVGEIDGHKVHYTEYEAAREQLKEVYKIETGRSDFDEDMEAQLTDQVWQTMMIDYALRAQAEKIGMVVAPNELYDICAGQHVHSIISQRRAFQDETGRFNRENLIRFLSSIEQASDDEQQNGNLKQAKSYWLYWENIVRTVYMQEKYTSLVQNMITANKLDAKYAFEGRQVSMDADFVMQPYYTVTDSTITVKDSELKKLYEERKSMYKQEPNRGIEYITFALVPSEQDSIEVYNQLNSIYQEFCSGEDIALVVNANSDLMYDGRNYTETTIPTMFHDFAFQKGAKVGDVTELIYTAEDRTFRMARLVACGYTMPDSVELKAIASDTTQEDQELGWFTEDVLRIQNKEIAEKAFAGHRGERFKVPMGLNEQEFEIMDIAASSPRAKVAIVERKVTPSSKTYSTIYNQAKQFIVDNNTEETFRAAAEQQHMTLYPAYNLTATTHKVGQLHSSRPIVRWAFEAKEGQISDVYVCGEQFVIAILTDIKDGDYRPMADVQAELTIEARNHQKAALIKQALASATTLEEVAQITNTGIQHAEGITLSSNRMGNMNEPAVVGAALALEAGQMSLPIQGKQGVYVVKAGAQTRMEGEFNEEQEMQNLNMYISYTAQQHIMSQLLDNADVTDNRKNFQ